MCTRRDTRLDRAGNGATPKFILEGLLINVFFLLPLPLLLRGLALLRGLVLFFLGALAFFIWLSRAVVMLMGAMSPS